MSLDLGAGLYLAGAYAAWGRQLAPHWPDDEGLCMACGVVYPCAVEVHARAELARIEALWRAESARFNRLLDAAIAEEAGRGR